MSGFFAEPSQWEIAYGKFPYIEAPSSPGMDFHPCLVLDVFVDEQTGEPWVVVAFGTSRNVGQLIAGEFAVLPEHGAAFAKSGLRKPTKFLLERHRLAKLPYNDEWFAVPPERRGLQNHPRVGILDAGRYSKALQAAGNAVDIVRTLRDLESVAFGALSPIELDAARRG